MNVIIRELTKTNAASSTKPFILLEWQTLLAIECRTHPYLHHYLGQIPAKQGATGQSRVGNAARSCHPLVLSPQGGNTRNIQEHLLHPSCQLYQWCLTLLNWSKLCSVEVTITSMAGPSTRISCTPGFDPCWLGTRNFQAMLIWSRKSLLAAGMWKIWSNLSQFLNSRLCTLE